ncbi:hypothetical protein DRE_01397 [Drechslerella stenobrocha 248]|uniref:Large ribosomal subunit protein eL24-related N-terminal domain-containing protein n=1 Tax=Drechslerella stenobrocha 248 TaxID=1043628 RepID=W7I5P3_9PEZI|nr:hypothetical protein DRE_01397 [Drechslerella stenobrocha 248]
MKRNPRKLKWTKAFRKSANKEMIVDSTLSFAARRNIPTRYSRELIATTLKTMQRVSELHEKRERAFYRQRMAGNSAARRAADRKLVEENQHMLPEVRARLSQAGIETAETDESEAISNEDAYAVALPKTGALRKRQRALEQDSMDIE